MQYDFVLFVNDNDIKLVDCVTKVKISSGILAGYKDLVFEENYISCGTAVGQSI